MGILKGRNNGRSRMSTQRAWQKDPERGGGVGVGTPDAPTRWFNRGQVEHLRVIPARGSDGMHLDRPIATQLPVVNRPLAFSWASWPFRITAHA